MNQIIGSSGGPVVLVLLALSVSALTIIFFKVWQFRQLRAESSLAEEFLKHYSRSELPQAKLIIQAAKAPRGHLLKQSLELSEHGRLAKPDLELELFRVAKAKLTELSSYLRVLEVIAAMAPLLGLLGTVLGMIEAFQAMEAAGTKVDPSALSGGVWQALLTTAVGLAVAIPVSVVHGWLERRLELLATSFENDLQRFFTARAMIETKITKNVQSAM